MLKEMVSYPRNLKDPKTCRVFFSSPFGGMEDEREELTKRYFPEFNHICSQRGVQFVAVDMRWGITSEASASGQVINICLRELDRSDLFVGLFGQRYGWHGVDDTDLQGNFDSAIGRYPWLDKFRDKSMTELEFLHGHLNHPGALPAFICFRDKAYDDKIRSEGERKGDQKMVFKYSSESELATKMIDDLKQRVLDTKDKTLGVLIDYKTPKEAAEGIYKAILDHLKNYLLVNDTDVESTTQSLTSAQHEAFLISRTKLYEGYGDIISQLSKNLDLENPKNILVLGPAGCGKSALLCNWINQVKSSSGLGHCCLVYHFIGYAQDSTSMGSILTRIVEEFEFIVSELKGKELKKRKTTDNIRELMRKLAVAMETLVSLGKQPVIVLDGLSKVEKPTSGLEKPLYFLPKSLPSRSVLIVATKYEDTDNVTELKEERGYQVIELPPLDSDTKRSICIQTLKEAGKELSANQLEKVIQDKQTENPLFLKITLNELVMFGYFRLLDRKIDSLVSSQSVDELFEKVLQRFEDDYNDKESQDNIVEKIMCCIYLSNYGLSENEIKELCNIDAQSWSPLYFAMDSYLIQQAGKLVLGFSELKESIAKRYLQDCDKRNNYLKMMVKYFDSMRQKSILIAENGNLSLTPAMARASSELPFLLKSLGDSENLAKVLADPMFFLCAVKSNLDIYQMIRYWKTTNIPWIKVANQYRESVEVFIADCYIFLEEVNELDKMSPGLIVGKRLMVNLCSMFKLIGHFDSCVLLHKMFLNIMEQNVRTGKLTDLARVDTVKYELACLYIDYGQFTEGERLHHEVLNHRKHVYEELGDAASTDVKTALGHSYNGIGLFYLRKEDYDKSEEYIRESMRIAEDVENMADKGAALTNLCCIALFKKEYEKALKYSSEALQIIEEEDYGHVPPAVGNLLNNTGLIYRRMGDIEKAEKHYKRALEIKKRALGEFHKDVPVSLLNLGVVEEKRGNYKKSVEYYEEGLNIYRTCKVPENADTYLKMQENRLHTMWKMNQFEDVLKDFFPFFDILERENRVGYCLGFFVTNIVNHLITQERHKDALRITLALLNSKQIRAMNVVHLDYLDTVMSSSGERPKRPEQFSLDAALKRWPTSRDLLEQKLTNYLFPQRDTEEVVQLLDTLHANTDKGTGVYGFALQLLDSEDLDHDMVLAISEAGLAKYPGSVDFLEKMASTRMAQKYFDLAIPHLLKIVEIDPTNPAYVLQIIQSAALSNNIEVCNKYCKIARERFGDNEAIMNDVDKKSKLLQQMKEEDVDNISANST